MFNIAWRRVGGLMFIKIGRLTFSYSISKRYKPLKPAKHKLILL